MSIEIDKLEKGKPYMIETTKGKSIVGYLQNPDVWWFGKAILLNMYEPKHFWVDSVFIRESDIKKISEIQAVTNDIEPKSEPAKSTEPQISEETVKQIDADAITVEPEAV